MEFIRFVFRALLLAIALGLSVELFVPGGDRIVDVATAVFALATWIVPLLILARWQIRPPRTSLGSVGFSISLMAFAISLSLITIALALLDFIFAGGGAWACRSLLAVAAFWVAGGAWLSISGRKPVKRDTAPPL